MIKYARDHNSVCSLLADISYLHLQLALLQLCARDPLGLARPGRLLCVSSLARSRAFVPLTVAIVADADIVCTKARSFMTDDDASTTTSAVARANNRPRDYIQQKLDRGKVLKDAMGQGMWFI